jgi:hypothetical protein
MRVLKQCPPSPTGSTRHPNFEMKFLLVLLICASTFPSTALGQTPDPVPTTRRVDVEWPNLQEAVTGLRMLNEKAGQKLTIEADLAEVRIPVLVPERAANLNDFTVRAPASGDQYFATARARGLKVFVIGSRIVSDPPPQSPAATRYVPTTGEYSITRTETGLLLGITRYGVPYTIAVECQRKSDIRCTNDKFIRSLADSMTLIGGKP